MRILANLILSGFAVFAAAYIVPGTHIDSFMTAVIVAVVLGIVNSTIGIILKILTFPLNIMTLGLISVVINILMVLLVANLVPGFELDGFFNGFIFALILGIINIFIGKK